MLLLDEPTSALDARAQERVQRAIDDLKDVTLIVVAHRLSTLQAMDRIIVMSEGRIVEVGAYTDLARTNGRFSRLLRAGGHASREDD